MAKQIKKTIISDMIYYYQTSNVSLQEVANTFNISYRTVLRYFKLNNIKIFKIKRKSWNSGLTKDTDSRVASYSKAKSKDYIVDGYRMVWCDAINKSIREHHKVWFENTGLWPNTKIEQIHHIDGDKLNNDFTNLLLCSVSDHTKIHKKYEKVTELLLKNKLISLDKDLNININKLRNILEGAGWKIEE